MKIQNESLASIKRRIRNYAAGAAMPVRITTARALSSGEYKELLASLAQKLGREVVAEAAVDPALIGGIIIQCGDRVFDGSVARQLAGYKEMMSKIDIKRIGVTDAI